MYIKGPIRNTRPTLSGLRPNCIMNGGKREGEKEEEGDGGNGKEERRKEKEIKEAGGGKGGM